MSEPGDEVGDFESMLEWFTGNGQEHRAYQAIERGDYVKALGLLEPLAARNSTNAMLNLGWLYETGKLGAPDLDVARSHYERAAQKGSAEASRRLGQLLLNQGNQTQARAAFTHGAEAENISCMYWLGWMILEGQGGLASISEGTAWLEKAASEGHIYAKRELLVLERVRADSVLRKLLIQWQIVALAKDAVMEVWKDADSEKLR